MIFYHIVVFSWGRSCFPCNLYTSIGMDCPWCAKLKENKCTHSA
jgi:hypothetical protein